MSRKIDIIIFGASGSTGKFVTEEMHRICKKHKAITWAIAGRSNSLLKRTLKDLQDKTGDDLSDVHIIVADLFDENSMISMTVQTKVLLNCCGPFIDYGENVTRACIQTGTHYVDVSAEAFHIETILFKYDEAAKNAGVYVINACGLVSLAAEMGVQHLTNNFRGQLNSAEAYMITHPVQDFGIGDAFVYYTSWVTLINTLIYKHELKLLRRKLFPKNLPKMLPEMKTKSKQFFKSSSINKWCTPEYTCMESALHRTQRYFHEHDKKRPIQIRAFIACESFFHFITITIIAFYLCFLVKFRWGQKLALKHPKIFSLTLASFKGPSVNRIKNTKTSLLIYGEGWDANETNSHDKTISKSMTIQISGQNYYIMTATAAVCACLTVIIELEKLTKEYGVLPAGVVFKETELINLLNENGIEFNIMQ